jgi:cytidylate kinase
MSTGSHGWVGANLEARISAHVHAWDKARETGHKFIPEHYPFITVSRQFGCDGRALASTLAGMLNERFRPSLAWVSYDQELLDRVANELHLRRAVVESLAERRRSEMVALFDSLLNSRAQDPVIIRKMAEVVRSLAEHGHCVLLGRGSHMLTQDLKTGLHIRLEAPFDWRVHNVASNRNISQDEAVKVVQQGQIERERYLRSFFAWDPTYPLYHDLVIDNSRFNLSQIAEIVFTALSVRFGEALISA